MSKRARQYIGIISAVVIYYIIHEGAHLLTALAMGVFKQINFMGIGVQIDVYSDRMSDFQMGIFCLAGAAARIIFGVLLVVNAFVFIKAILPEYKTSFAESGEKK